jgi:hypothetical protein
LFESEEEVGDNTELVDAVVVIVAAEAEVVLIAVVSTVLFSCDACELLRTRCTAVAFFELPVVVATTNIIMLFIY